MPTFGILGPTNISENVEARNFKFGIDGQQLALTIKMQN